MALQVIGEVQPGAGERAENDILDLILDKFDTLSGKLFVNTVIPGHRRTPDFVLPVYNKNREITFLVIECKASRNVFPDGSNQYSDSFKQISKYVSDITYCFAKVNRKINIDSFVIYPNSEKFSSHIRDKGRNGTRWGNLNDLNQWLDEYTLVEPSNNLINAVYDTNRYRKNFRIEKMDNQQREYANIKFGGTWKYGGLAGSGKTIVLAEKMINDSKLKDVSNLIYLTQNKNLVITFYNHVVKRLEEKGIKYKVDSYSRDGLYPVTISVFGDSPTKLNFCVYDAFATNFITEHFDKVLFKKDYYGPLFSIAKEYLPNQSTDTEGDYTGMRNELKKYIENHMIGRQKDIEIFDCLYVDEFQDCRIDPSCILFPMLFTKKLEKGDPNLIFTEDLLQTYVKYETYKMINEDLEDVLQKDIAKNKDLGIEKAVGGRVKPLDVIYRTPENIFKPCMNLLDKTGGLKKDKLEELMQLKFYQPHGKVKIVEFEEYLHELEEKTNEYSPSKVILISEMMKGNNLIPSRFPYPWHKAITRDLFKEGHINILHEKNARGLEAEVVFIMMSDYLLENPNYLYTLICRTQREIVLVKGNDVSEEKFRDVVEHLNSDNLFNLKNVS